MNLFAATVSWVMYNSQGISTSKAANVVVFRWNFQTSGDQVLTSSACQQFSRQSSKMNSYERNNFIRYDPYVLNQGSVTKYILNYTALDKKLFHSVRYLWTGLRQCNQYSITKPCSHLYTKKWDSKWIYGQVAHIPLWRPKFECNWRQALCRNY